MTRIDAASHSFAVILNSFQDNEQTDNVLLKQVQHDERAEAR